jgi:hypothetical protein
MSFISDIFAGGTEGVLKGVKDVIGTFKADPLEIAKLDIAMAKLEADLSVGLSQAQTKINEIEAASNDKFVSRWRPAIGWICGAAYAYTFVIQPFLVFLLTATGHTLDINSLPTISLAELSVVLGGLLGLGGMRSFDKWSAKK